MNLSLWIARRYFTARKKRSFISIISRIAMLGVGVGTMALVVVLSVFNGMEDLNRQLFRRFDADLKVTPAQGKRFELSDKQRTALEQIPGVLTVTPVIEDNALARYGDRQAVIRVKGVADNYLKSSRLDSAMIEGKLQLNAEGEPKAVIGATVQGLLSLAVQDYFTPLELWYPRNGRTLNMNSPDAFNQQLIRVAGVYSLDARFDSYVVAPLDFVSQLLDYGKQRTALELQLQPNASLVTIQAQVRQVMGEAFVVKNRDELNANLLRSIQFEKLFVTVALGLIVLVAAVNIFFSLSMLVLEKKEDIKMLVTMGATPQVVRRIFLFEGALVAFTGAIVGLLAGTVLCWVQQTYGLVSMGMVSALVDAYPVKMEWKDFAVTGLTVVGITLLVSFLPATRAAKIAPSQA